MDGQARAHLLGDFESAAARFRQVLAIRPEEPLALLLYAELLALRGDTRLAPLLAERALARCVLEPMRHLCDYVVALAAWVAGDHARAVQHAERSVGAQPMFVPALALLAVAEVAADLMDQARASVLRLLQVEPGFSCESFLASCAARPGVADQLGEGLRRAGAPTSGRAASS
jgi:tetratricopeptide (TPR) repeat protein